MKCYDLKIAKPTGEGKAFWRTIGTVFMADSVELVGANGKPATFVIDYPKANGIIVPRQAKKSTDDSTNEPENTNDHQGNDDVPF